MQGARGLPADTTLILMVDNRSPLEEDVYRAPYYSLTAAINCEYARNHGYSFRYYLVSGIGQSEDQHPRSADRKYANKDTHQNLESWWRRWMYFGDVFFMRSRCFLSFPSSRLDRWFSTWRDKYGSFQKYVMPTNSVRVGFSKQKAQLTCVHSKWGPRAAPWSKLLALDDAMAKGYNRIVYIDSDAIFNRLDVNVDDFLASSTSTLAPIEEAALTLTFNYPWTQIEATSGFMIWKNTERAREILHHWWNIDAGDYHVHHDYEQHTLNNHLLQDVENGYKEHIAIIPTITFLERKKQYVRHVANPHSRARLSRFRYGLKAFGINSTAYRNLIREIEHHHLIWFDTRVDGINLRKVP